MTASLKSEIAAINADTDAIRQARVELQAELARIDAQTIRAGLLDEYRTGLDDVPAGREKFNSDGEWT
jgi:hypothetical protein